MGKCIISIWVWMTSNNAAIVAQWVEALAVAIGLILIFGQIRQLRTERTHKRWDATQWALTVFGTSDARQLIVKSGELYGKYNKNPKATISEEEYHYLGNIIDKLSLIKQALLANYIDSTYLEIVKDALDLCKQALSKIELQTGIAKIFIDELVPIIEDILAYKKDKE